MSFTLGCRDITFLTEVKQYLSLHVTFTSVPKLKEHCCMHVCFDLIFFLFLTEVHRSGIWHGQPVSFSGDPSFSAHSSTPLLDGPTSLQQQDEYLRSLTENATGGNFQVEGLEQGTQLSMSPDQMGSVLEAITRGQEFPRSSTLTSQNSSSGMWHASSVPFGDTSAAFGMISNDPSFLLTPSINGQFCQSQHTIVTGAGIITSSNVVTGGSDYTPASYGVTQSMGDIDGCPQQGVSSDLAGINPFDAGTEIDIDRYHIPDLEVKFCDLENRVFEKQQSRKDKKARQRIINGKVKFLVRSERQVKSVKAWVQREENAAKLEKDENGMVSIEVVFLRKLKDSGSVSSSYGPQAQIRNDQVHISPTFIATQVSCLVIHEAY